MAQAVTDISKRRLVLHFDINNTILMNDKSKNLNTLDNVSYADVNQVIGRKNSLQIGVGTTNHIS
jgi:hypothetical protein